MSWPRTDAEFFLRGSDRAPLPTGYLARNKATSGENEDLDLYWQGQHRLSLSVAPNVFNPSDSIVCAKFLDQLFGGNIAVAGKRIVDLGCGSGILGLCTISLGASSVVFTDINPHVAGIRNHPLFRECDECRVQDMLADEPDESRELVLALPPAMVSGKDQVIDADTIDTGVFRPPDFYSRILSDSARVLTPGGSLVMWLRMPFTAAGEMFALMGELSGSFDLTRTSVLASGIESRICIEHENSALNRWLYKHQKGGVQNDGWWLLMSFEKQSG
jgi:SAM-dependent methyltransferase